MGIASVGSLGSANYKTASQTTTLSPSRNVPAGRLLVVWYGQDGHAPGSASPTMCQFWSCKDSAGNIWSTAVARDNGTTTFATGAIFYCVLKNALTTSDVITVKYVNSLPVARAISAEEFSLDDGFVIATTDRGPQSASGTGDPAAITQSSLTSQQYLGLHFLASKGPISDAFTWDADWTQIAADGTSGGADSSNASILGGYRIATLTSDTVDVTSDTADRPHTQGLVFLCQARRPVSFPTTRILDTFNRADESPLDNGKWSPDPSCTAAFNGLLRVISNQCATKDATVAAGEWWLELNQMNDAEVYVSQPVRPATPGSNRGTGVILHGAGCGNASTRGGLEALWIPAISGSQPNDVIVFGSCGNSAAVSPAFGLAWVDNTNGVKLGQSKSGNIQHVWCDVGGGWRWVAAIHRSAANPTSGKMGLELVDTAIRVDDFGGGGSWTPQVIRHQASS